MKVFKSIGTASVIAVLSLACHTSWGQTEINIVSPSELDASEANDSVNGGPAVRLQFLYPAADFMSLPPSHQTITGLAWRPDQGNTFANPIIGPARFLLSTTDADQLNAVYASNVGDNETLVFDGTVTWQATTSGPGPRDFEFDVSFDQPFAFDPTQDGNLLVEFVAPADWNVVEGWQIDAQRNPTGNITAIGGGPLSNVATASVPGLWPAQFTFVPEPSTGALSCLGCVALLAWRRKS